MATPEMPENMGIPLAECECGQTLFSSGQKSGGNEYCQHEFRPIQKKQDTNQKQAEKRPFTLPALEESIAFKKLTVNVDSVDEHTKHFADSIAKLKNIYDDCVDELTDRFEELRDQLSARETQLQEELTSLYDARLKKLEDTKEALETHSKDVQYCKETCQENILTIHEKDKIAGRVTENVKNIETLINKTPKIQDVPIKLACSFIQLKKLETTIKSFGSIKSDRMETGSKLKVEKWETSNILANDKDKKPKNGNNYNNNNNNNINIKMPSFKPSLFKHQSENDGLLLKFVVKDQGQENYENMLQSHIFLQVQCIQTDFDEKDVENWDDTQLTCQYFQKMPPFNPKGRYETGLNNEYFEKGKRIHLRARLIYVSNPDVVKHGQVVDIKGSDNSVVPDNQTNWLGKNVAYGKRQAQVKEYDDAPEQVQEQEHKEYEEPGSQQLPSRVRIKVSFTDKGGAAKTKSVQLKEGKYSLSELTAKTLKLMKRESNYQISFTDGQTSKVLQDDGDFVSVCVLGDKYDDTYNAMLQVSEN